MKNIADGLLAGTAQISKGNAAKRDRNDQFTLTAFGEVLADQRAQEKFGRDQTLAEIRAGGAKTEGVRPNREAAILAQVQSMRGEPQYMTTPPGVLLEIATEIVDTVRGSGTEPVQIQSATAVPAGTRALDNERGIMVFDGTSWTVDPDQSPIE
jgi:hypothetical protein